MAGLKEITLELEGVKDLALLSNRDDSVWLVVPPFRWYEFATLIWWYLFPTDKRGFVTLKLYGGRTVRTRVLKLATRHVRVSGF